MSVTEETLRLVLDTIGEEKFAKAAAKVQEVAAAEKKAAAETYEFADVYEVLEIQVQATRRSLDAVDFAMEEVGQSAAGAAAGVGKMEAATKASGKGIGGLQQQITAAGYALQDFTATSGDLGAKLNSVSNNLPGLFAGLGPLGTGLAIVSTAGIAVYKNWDSISGLWEDRRPIEGATEGLDGLKHALDENGKALDTLREKGSLTLDQMVDFNKLLIEQTELEAKQAAARETEANRKAHDEHSNREDKERAEGFGKALDEAGGYEKVIDQFTKAEAQMQDATEEQVKSIRRAWEEAFNAALKGDAGMVRAIADFNRRDTTGRSGIFNTFLDLNDPAKQRETKKVDELNAQGLENQQAGIAARNAQKKKDDDLVDELNAQGLENQQIGVRQREAQEAKGDKDAGKARREDARHQNAPAVDAETATIKRNGYAEMAGSLLAQTRAQGGAVDQYGRFHKLNESQQLEYVRREVEKELARRNPRMDAEQRGDLSMRISGMGRDQVDRQVLENGGRQNMNTEKLLGISAALFGQAQQQAAIIQDQGRRIDQLMRDGNPRQRNQFRRGKS